LQDPMFDAIRQDPVGGAVRCQAQVEEDHAGFRRCHRLRIAEAYLITLLLQASFPLWKLFLRLEYFKGQRKLSALNEETFRPFVGGAVMQFTFNPTRQSQAKENRAWKYARAVEAYADAGVPAEEVADRIEQDGGIEALCRKAAQDTPRRKVKELTVACPEKSDAEPRKYIKLLVSEDEYYDHWLKMKLESTRRMLVTYIGTDENGIPQITCDDVEP
jgi:hypothetical protein